MAKINFKAVAILVVASVIYFTYQSDKSPDDSASKIEQSSPEIEKSFISVVSDAQMKAKDVSNDMQLGGLKPKRASALCSLLTSKSVSEWTGKVTQISSNGDGKGVLSIEISKDITIKTWNNSLSDINDKTLIDPSSQLFSDASALNVGDLVSFSGEFIPSESDCIRESSMGLDGSIKEPEFIFRFSGIKKI